MSIIDILSKFNENYVILFQLSLLSLLIQASCLHHDLQNSSTARRIRRGLIPITISLLAWVGYRIRVEFFKDGRQYKLWSISIGSMVLLSILRSIMWGTAEDLSKYRIVNPSNPQPRPEKDVSDKDASNRSDSRGERLGPILQRLFFGHRLMSDIRGVGFSFGQYGRPSKVISGKGDLNDYDGRFMVETLQRTLMNHLICSVATIGVICVGSDSWPEEIGRSAWLDFLRPWILTILGGTMAWTMIDLSGCLVRFSLVGSKYLGRFMDKFGYCKLKERMGFDEIRLENHKFFLNHPYKSTSLTDFWGRRWHSLLRQIFIECGSNPIQYILINWLGCRSATIIGFGKVMGAFMISGILHEFALWYSTYPDLKFSNLRFFLIQGVGVCLELTFEKVFKRKVGGLIGWIWSVIWVVYWARLMILTAFEHKVMDPEVYYQGIKQYSVFVLLAPFTIPYLLLFPPKFD